jgi:protein involved in polysaccharide export with SLBB domain
MKHTVILAIAAAALLAGAAPAAAQGWDPGRVQLTRADLQKLLADYEQAAVSPAHSARYRAQARAEADAIRARLRDGDVQAGDQIALIVEGQQALSDTFTVRSGGVLFLPQIGDISVAGLLRSEVEGRLREQLARYIRDPVVRARPLVRLAVEGEVRSPGYYVVPADALLTDVLMAAGGPTSNGSLARLRIDRGGQPVWQGQALNDAIAQGRTLDVMGVHPGDRIYMGNKPSNVAGVLIRAVPTVVSLGFLVTQL